MSVDEFSQALETDSQLVLSCVPDYEVFQVPETQEPDCEEVSSLLSQLVEPSPMLAHPVKEKKSKTGTTMKWPPFLSTFVLKKMCDLIASWVRTEKGFKEDHPKDAEFLNKPIANYNQLQTIFSFGLATGRHAMGSSEPLGTPDGEPDTQESKSFNVDADKGEEGADKPTEDKAGPKKRKRGVLVDEEVVVFTSMTEAVREVSSAIRDSVPVDVHPGLYEAVMIIKGFSDAAKMVALSHLLDNKAQGQGFVTMAEDHQRIWLHTFLTKHYYQ
ncbi:unnamed protein product [Alopecurus aequalis]